jgi:hypothetical protein
MPVIAGKYADRSRNGDRSVRKPFANGSLDEELGFALLRGVWILVKMCPNRQRCQAALKGSERNTLGAIPE